MKLFQVELTVQELEDIRLALISKFLDFGNDEPDKADRINDLSTKLARVSVVGYA